MWELSAWSFCYQRGKVGGNTLWNIKCPTDYVNCINGENNNKITFLPVVTETMRHWLLSLCPETAGCPLVNFSSLRLLLGIILTKIHVDYKKNGEIGTFRVTCLRTSPVPGLTYSEYYCKPGRQLGVPSKLTVIIMGCTNFVWYILIVYLIYMLIMYPIYHYLPHFQKCVLLIGVIWRNGGRIILGNVG